MGERVKAVAAVRVQGRAMVSMSLWRAQGRYGARELGQDQGHEDILNANPSSRLRFWFGVQEAASRMTMDYN